MYKKVMQYAFTDHGNDDNDTSDVIKTHALIRRMTKKTLCNLHDYYKAFYGDDDNDNAEMYDNRCSGRMITKNIAQGQDYHMLLNEILVNKKLLRVEIGRTVPQFSREPFLTLKLRSTVSLPTIAIALPGHMRGGCHVGARL